MAEQPSLIWERQRRHVVDSSPQTTREAPADEDKTIVRSSGKAVPRKPLQHPAELPRNKPSVQSARRQNGTKILSAQSLPPSVLPRKASQIEDWKTEMPQAIHRDLPEQYPKHQTRRSSHPGGDSVQSRRTSIQSRAETTHRKQPSKEKIDELSRPKHITPKKITTQKASWPQTERKAPRPIKNPKAVAKQRGVDLPLNDQWSNSKVEREETRGPPEMYIERIEQPIQTFDSFSGLTSFLGWDNKRQHAMEMEIMSLEKRLLSSQKKNEELNYNLSELSHANDGLVDDLRKVQQKSFNQMTKSAWTPLEDRAIQDVLEDIHQDIEAWAENNCVESFEKIQERLDESQQAELFEACKNVVNVTQDDLATQFQWWEERDVDPVLLFTALATFHMYLSVFNNEFLALEAVEEGSMSLMLDVYRKLADLDSKQAHVWRSQLMRIVVGTLQSAGRFDGIRSKLDVSGLIKRHCADLLDEFERRPEAAFWKSEQRVEGRESLLNCWTRAAELFVQLQTQVAKVQWSATENLRSTVDPRFVKSHRSQALPKGRNDGKPISLIISPIVMFFGNEDGEKYEYWRAVCKASVLVIDEEIEEEIEEETEEEDTEEESVSEEYDGEDEKEL